MIICQKCKKSQIRIIQSIVVDWDEDSQNPNSDRVSKMATVDFTLQCEACGATSPASAFIQERKDHTQEVGGEE